MKWSRPLIFFPIIGVMWKISITYYIEYETRTSVQYISLCIRLTISSSEVYVIAFHYLIDNEYFSPMRYVIRY